MKNIIIFIILFLLITIKNFAIEAFTLYSTTNFNSNYTKSLSNNNFSSNYILGFDYDQKRMFTHAPQGTEIMHLNMHACRIGISQN